jgi:hypothetical protein
MPGRSQPWPENQQPLVGLVTMTEGRWARLVPDFQEGPLYDYRVAVCEVEPAAKKANGKPFQPTDADDFFDRAREKLKNTGGNLIGEEKLRHREDANAPGRQWTFDLGETGGIRIVRVYVINGHVYYLSAQGPGLIHDYAEFGEPFFGSFFVKIN